MSETIKIFLSVCSILNILFAVIVVFFERKNIAVTWAWLMVILIIPYGGFLIYLALGLDSRKYRNFLLKSRQDILLSKATAELRKMSINHKDSLMDLNFVSSDSILTENNSIEQFCEGKDKFNSLIKDIKQAKKYVHMEYYIFNNDMLGNEIISALIEKLKQGVEIKLMIDPMGSRYNSSKNMFKKLIDAGGQFSVFLKSDLIRLNYRNHRKLAIIDGEIGYIGGFNVGDEYLGISERFGHWRDAHIKVCGDAVKEMQLRFVMDWNYSLHNKFNKIKEVELSQKYFPACTKQYGNVKTQIVSSGPDTKWDSIQNAYQKMISSAQNSIYIQTPYFVPDDSVFSAIKIAALSGVDIKIMIPKNPDHPFVYWAALSYLGELLDTGVKCFQYKEGFVHSKIIMVDGKVCSVGTANMDVRSFKLNFETNAFIYDEQTTKTFEKQFLKDLEDCEQMTPSWYLKRSNATKIKESISRLLSPIL